MNIDGHRVRQVACGLDHSCFLTEERDIFTSGKGDKGQLGIGYTSLREFKPLKIKNPKCLDLYDAIKSVACGAYHTMFITEKRKVYAFGQNLDGQLALDNTPDSETSQLNFPVLSPSLSTLDLV